RAMARHPAGHMAGGGPVRGLLERTPAVPAHQPGCITPAGRPMASTPRTSEELASTLQQLRAASGLNSENAAAAARMSRSRLSRLEGNVFTPKPEEVEALCDVYRAPAATRRAMLAVVEDVRGRPTPSRAILYKGGSARMQQRVDRVEKSSR